MTELPSGTVTFLFTDVEGSTRLLHELGPERYAEALADHRRIVREACAVHGGVEVDTQGDAFFVAFPDAPGALAAASEMTARLDSGRVRLRMGLHTGMPLLTGEGYVGDDVHLGARVAAAAHGGQIVLSAATRAALGPSYKLSLGLLDLGEHRLKDIEGPVQIYQLGQARFPPLKTISNTNLPRPASSFVGREAELQVVLDRLCGGGRLLTLTGPGGSGKTRLALEAASTLVPEYRAGVFWVGLAALRDPSLVTEQIAQTLGAKDALAAHIGEREMLLLLDNLEQVVEAAPELSALLSACPNLTLLCTSRELLRVQGEVEYAVPPLASAEAVSLFCERAQLEPSDEIAELCARLDDLPLAVELAAARTKALTPAQILGRLSQRLDLLSGGRDADPRQQTLRATIAWSHELLSEEEQRLFRALSVFAGGCKLEAAEEVADADLDTLQSLVEKSLLRFTDTRYWMLETIREFAAEQLEESGLREEMRGAHAAHFSALAADAEPHLAGTREQAAWLERIGVEHFNFREALSFLEARAPTEMVRMAAALWRFWHMRSYFGEGRDSLRRAIELDTTPSRERQEVLEGAAYMAYVQGDVEQMRSFAEEQLAEAKELGDGQLMGQALHLLGHLAGAEGDRERATRLYKESLTWGDFPRRGDALYAVAHQALPDDDYEEAVIWLEQAQAVNRAHGDDWALAGDLVGLGYALHGRGLDDEARRIVQQSIELLAPLGEKQLLARSLDALAATLADSEPGRAAALLGAAEALREEINVGRGTLSARWNPRTMSALQRRLSAESLRQSIERGRAKPEAALELALASID